MDHGMLNLPIGHRGRGGSIDAQIDSFKAEQARSERTERVANAATTKAQRIEAKRLLSEFPEERLASLAQRTGLTVTQLRKNLASDCHWQPEKMIRLLAA